MRCRCFYEILFSCALMFSILSCSNMTYAVEVTGSNITGGQWIDEDAKVRVYLDQMPQDGALRVFVGKADVTALFQISENEMIFQPGIFDLPKGEGEIKVYHVHAGQWDPVGSIAIQVRKISGFDQFEITPQLNVTIKSQLGEGHSVDAGAPPRSTFNDLTGQGGVNIDLARGDFSMQAQANLVGSSYRNEALRFAQKGASAPKVDLTDYLISMKKGNASLFVGGYQYQGSRYVMSNASNRGISASYNLSDSISLAATVQKTTSIVGFDDILGLNQSNDTTYGIYAGMELFERPGALKVEGYFSDASRVSDLGFNVGAITDAEKSQSMALRVLASSPESMFTIETEIAQSTFTNPNDPALDQGLGVVAVNKTTDGAFFGRFVFNVYQGSMTSGKPLSLSLSSEYERIDPLFKTIGAFPQADLDRRKFGFTAMLGDLNLIASTETRHDNLDGLSTILTTKTRDSQINASLSLREVFPVSDSESMLSLLLPSLNIGYTHTHQFGSNRPDLNPLSGFSLGHIPNQLTKAVNTSIAWNGDIWDLTYNYTRSTQDNRQQGREKADFSNTQNGVSGQIRLFDQLSINAGFSRNKGVDLEQQNSTYTWNRDVGLNWVLFDDWTLSGSMNLNRVSDTLQNASSRSLSANGQIAWQYSVPSYGNNKIPVQAYLRYDRQINETTDNVFGFSSNASDWKILAGVSVNVF